MKDFDDIEKYPDLGVRDFSLSTDMAILYRWLKEKGESLRRIFKGLEGN